MGIIAKTMIITMIIAVTTPLILSGPDGQPLKSIPGLSLDRITALTDHLFNRNQVHQDAPMISAPSATPGSPNELNNASIAHQLLAPSGRGTRSFYKWKDQNNVWQFTIQPPPDPNTDYHVITTDPNANIIQSLSKNDIAQALGWKTEEDEKKEDKKEKEDEASLPSMPIPSTIPADQIPKLIEQAKGVQELMNNRNKTLDKL